MNTATWKEITRATSENDFAMRITPSGIVEARRSWSEKRADLRASLGRIGYIVQSEIRAKVFDKAFGQLWLLLEPVIFAGLYYFVTAVVFSFTGEQRQFLSILAAVVFWRWFSRTVDGSPTCITGYGGVLKQTRFPVILVVLTFMATEAFFFAMSFFVLIAFLAAYGAYPSWAYVWLPLVLLAQIALTLFLTIIFAAIGTFIKDLAGVLYAITGVWWYLSPGIYPVSKIPKEWLWLYQLNPFAHILPAYQNILIDGHSPNWLPLCVILLVFTILSVIALRVFNWVRYYFFVFL